VGTGCIARTLRDEGERTMMRSRSSSEVGLKRPPSESLGTVQGFMVSLHLVEYPQLWTMSILPLTCASAVQTLLLCFHLASELFLPPPRPAPPTTELPPPPRAAPPTPKPCHGFSIFGRLNA
jgi:hypothetical protein